MKITKRFKQYFSIAALSGLVTTAAHAHPGHDTGSMLHGALHTEHLLLLLAIGVVIAIKFVIKE